MDSLEIGRLYDGLGENYVRQRETVWPKVGSLSEFTLSELIARELADHANVRVLDVGCGYGADLEMISRILARDSYSFDSFELSGVDVSSWMINEAQSRGYCCECKDFMTLDQAAEYQLVWSNMCLMHFGLDELPSAIDKLKQFVAPGGLLGVGVKTLPEPIVDLGKEFVNEKHGNITSDRLMIYFSEPQLRSLLSAGDFDFRAHVTVSSRDPEYTYSWLFVSRQCVK